MTPAPQPQGKLVYSSAPWKIYEQDAGMGERDYAVMIDDVFYCRTDDSQTAMKIVEAIRSRLAPSPQETVIGHRMKRQGVIIFASQTALTEHDTTIAAQAREKVLKKVCSQCPIKNEEMPLEDYSAESCEGCLIRKVVESLRTEAPQ